MAAISDIPKNSFTPGIMGEMTTRDVESALLYDGNLFHADVTMILAESGTGNIYLECTTDASVHVFAEISASTMAVITLYEDCGIDTAGTSITLYNMNRNSDSTSALAPQWDPVITTDGTAIHSLWVPTISNEVKLREWVLDDSKAYRLQVTNSGASTSTYGVELTVYQVDPTGGSKPPGGG